MSETNWHAVRTVEAANSDGAGQSLLTEDGPGPRPPLLVVTPGDAEGARPVLCHYCEVLPGTTVDHIVPRSRLPRGQRLLGLVTQNSVKACTHCNGRKSTMRVDCCERCLAAWQTWGPPDWEITVQVVSKIWVAKKARSLARQ